MKQDDEKELVLGNKQLISLFFVAAALCGVFFAMGYMMGRNTTKPGTATLETAATTQSEGHRTQPDSPREADVPLPSVDPPPTGTVETKPAQDSSVAPSTTPVETKTAETKAPEPKAAEYKSARTDRDPMPVASPEVGASYLQVAALPRPDAENMVRTLREQRLPVVMALSTKEGFYRVLVGPYRQNVQLSDAKTKLKALGFAQAFVQKQ